MQSQNIQGNANCSKFSPGVFSLASSTKHENCVVKSQNIINQLVKSSHSLMLGPTTTVMLGVEKKRATATIVSSSTPLETNNAFQFLTF
jgi:hypothetical protein